jgi:hypothetical protein
MSSGCVSELFSQSLSYQAISMTASIEYVDELDPFLSIELPEGWVRALIKHPIQAVDGEPTEIDRMFAKDLSPGLPEEPISTQLLFAYLHGYEPSTERPMNRERRVTVAYFPSREIYAIESEFTENAAMHTDKVKNWLVEAMSQVENEIDEWWRLWVALSDIHGLGKEGIGNLSDKYGTVEAVTDATEDELIEIPYITADLAPEVLSACEQWDGTVPEAPGDDVAKDADDPLAIDTSQLRPLGHLFEN